LDSSRGFDVFAVREKNKEMLLNNVDGRVKAALFETVTFF